MGLRSHLCVLLLQTLLIQGLQSAEIRSKREASISVENKHVLTDNIEKLKSSLGIRESYHPPLLAAPPAPTVTVRNPYQPPLLLAQSNDYKPLISSSQTQSVRYQPPNSPPPIPGYPLSYSYPQPGPPQTPPGYSAPLLANIQHSNSLPVPQDTRQGGLIYAGDHSSLNQFSQSPPQQQGAQGAETQPGSVAVVPGKTDGKPGEEYVVYYYYYYDNDTAANGSSNFDDIPSLESYDGDKRRLEAEKSASSRNLATDINSLPVNGQDNRVSSQPRSVSSGNPDQQAPFIRSDKPQEESEAQPLKPVSNVFRYGSNEVPRFPVLPNFEVSDPPPITRSGASLTSDQNLPQDGPVTESSVSVVAGPQGGRQPDNNNNNNNPLEGNDEENTVVDRISEPKPEEDRNTVEETTTTTTTELPTTTEPPTTTTEKSRRRPGAGGRRRFNPSPSFSPSRRPPTARSSTSTTTTTTVSPGASSTRSFRGSSRTRPRPTLSSRSSRPQTFSRNSPSSIDNEDTTKPSSDLSSSSTTSTTARPRFGSQSPSSQRRFQPTRTRSQPPQRSTSTTSTTTPVPRSRPSPSGGRPRPSLIPNRNRARPNFLRPKPGSEPEEAETTTMTPEPSANQDESSPPSSANESSEPEEEETDEDSEEEDSEESESEVPTTTEKSRFSALFRPRNRSPLNRPRPPVPSRTRRS